MHGAGMNGKHIGTRASFGTECMLFTLLVKEKVEGLIEDQKDHHSRLYSKEPLQASVLIGETVLS